MQTVAGLALLVISGKMLEIDLVDVLSVPAVILTGLVLSIKNPGAMSLTLQYIMPAVGTAVTATAFLYTASYLDRDLLDLRQIQRGGGLVLGIIALSMFGVEIPSNLGLAVFAVSLAYSYKPFREAGSLEENYLEV